MILGSGAISGRRIHRGVALAALSLAALTVGIQPARAATITVNSADDTTDQDAKCTLREAIANVNAASDSSGGDCTAGTGSGDTIVFNLTLPATITLTTNTELEIDSDVTITGPAAGVLTIDGNGQVSVFDITTGTVSIANLTILHGNSSGGGGIYNDGTLTLTNCILNNNVGDDGGGVYNDVDGVATLTGCTFRSNAAGNDFGGGAVYNDGVLTLSNSTISSNSAVDGGGVYNDADGMATVSNCTLNGNSASTDVGGGGIYNDGIMTVSGCTLSGNFGEDGGGFYNDVDGTATLANSTLSTNSATGNDFGGGGIYNGGSLTLANCTLSDNSAPVASGNNMYNDAEGTATVLNTIMATSFGGQNCDGTGVEQGSHNLSSDATCFSSPDLLNTNPLLAPLANNGGPTQTLALCTAAGVPGAACSGPSPAIDAGDDSITGPPLNLTTDQRGLARQSGQHVDIGAYEVQATTAAACVGDCDGSGDVTIDELITMVNIALGSAPLSACTAGDADGSGTVEITEIITAVNNTLNACPA